MVIWNNVKLVKNVIFVFIFIPVPILERLFGKYNCGNSGRSETSENKRLRTVLVYLYHRYRHDIDIPLTLVLCVCMHLLSEVSEVGAEENEARTERHLRRTSLRFRWKRFGVKKFLIILYTFYVSNLNGG